ncbi:MAG: hypothetical protein KGL39_03665 [Patescibacteria group bacterium]|nr:hypothetical protein [Patescibacteria group bacterium]
MTIGSPSGTYTFNPAVSDLILESFDRCGVRPTALTREHMISARRSCNFVLSRWSLRGVNLWEVDLQTIPLIQGVATYDLPDNTVQMLDVYFRTYQMGSVISQAPSFTTSSGSATVTVAVPNNGLIAGNWVNIIIPVSVGGLVLSGFYQAVTVPSTTTFTITASSLATANVSAGGAVPVFTTTVNSTSVNVLLNDHGLVAGGSFTIQVATTVGGVQLFGVFTVATVVDANNFTITAPNYAGATQTVAENSGEAQITTQTATADPIDQIVYPISRTDYASLPDKFSQGLVTQYWFDRLTPTPTVTLWQVPSNQGPMVLQYYRMRQTQDANPTTGQTLDVPYRFLDAFCWELAFNLAIKYAQAAAPVLKALAKEAWDESAAQDTARESLYISPQLQTYYE